MTIIKVNNHEFYMDDWLKQNLDIAKSVIKQDWDMTFLCDGKEGAGKSTLILQAAYYCDPSFNIDRIAFTPKEFKKNVLAADKYSSVVYDEAYSGLQARAAMSLINRTLVSMMAEIRQKNLFLFIVAPSFFDMDKYIAIFRSRALFSVYTGENFERGFFKFYNEERKKELYILGKKFYVYPKSGMGSPNFQGKFTMFKPVSDTEYKKRKLNALNERMDKQSNKEADTERLKYMFERLQETEGLTHEKRAEILSMPISTYYTWLRKYEGANSI